MKIGILNSENYFEETECGWQLVDVSSCESKLETDEKIIEMLDDLSMLGEDIVDLNSL